MYINADHLRTERRKPVPDTRNAEVLPNLWETVAGYRHRTILRQRPVCKQIHSDGGTQQTMGERRLIDANAFMMQLREIKSCLQNELKTEKIRVETVDFIERHLSAAPVVSPESLRPVSEWELNPDRWTCEWFRCKTCHHLSCCADPFCGGCGAKMKNAGASTDDLNEPKEETFDMG